MVLLVSDGFRRLPFAVPRHTGPNGFQSLYLCQHGIQLLPLDFNLFLYIAGQFGNQSTVDADVQKLKCFFQLLQTGLQLFQIGTQLVQVTLHITAAGADVFDVPLQILQAVIHIVQVFPEADGGVRDLGQGVRDLGDGVIGIVQMAWNGIQRVIK